MNNLIGPQSIAILLLFFTIVIGIFLLIRWFMLWYWKVNTIVENQEKSNDLLLKILIEVQRENNPSGSTKSNVMSEEEVAEQVRMYEEQQARKRAGY
jgi:hypothetical protein